MITLRIIQISHCCYWKYSKSLTLST